MLDTTPEASRDIARVTFSVLGIGLLIAGSIWVMLPFLPALLWATTIVVSTWPLMRGLQARLGNRRWAAVTVMTVVLLLVLFLPLSVAISTIVGEADRIAGLARELPSLTLPPPPEWIAGLPIVGHKAAERWAELAALSPEELAARLAPYLRTALAWFAARAGSFGAMVGQFLLTVGIAAVLYATGEAAAARVRRFFRRLTGAKGEGIVDLSGQAIRAVALGVVVTAAVQTVLAAVGLFAAGVPFAGLISAIVLVLCIAQLGPLLAMLPAVIWLYATGSPVRGTVLLVFMVVAVVIDNVLRPVLIRKGADISLFVILPGVIGGLLWLGVIGLFVGPVVLAVTTNLLDRWIATGTGEMAPAPEPAAQAAVPPGQAGPPA